ncbi:MAG: hypothetical protein HY360_11555 [Verrucomicrobia bacterium]|nr:hypothetical protein [Verrucomicrobiota bacterium]
MNAYTVCAIFHTLTAAALFAAANTVTAPPSVPAKPVTSVPAKSEDAPPPASSSAPETTTKAKREAPTALDQKGKIQSIDVTNRTFAVEGKTFTLTPKGKVFVDGQKQSLSDLKDGDLVAVVYFAKSDGTNSATRVIKGHKPRAKKSADDSKSGSSPTTGKSSSSPTKSKSSSPSSDAK